MYSFSLFFSPSIITYGNEKGHPLMVEPATFPAESAP